MPRDEQGDSRAGGRAARVLKTGLAVVHEGELVLPAAGSEAQAEQVIDDQRTVIHYHFPVEIEVRAAPEAPDTERIVEMTLSRLARSMEAL